MISIEAIQNHKYDLVKAKAASHISSEMVEEIMQFHQSIGNKVTPLIALSGLAKNLGIQSLFIKDESHVRKFNILMAFFLLLSVIPVIFQ